MNIDKNKMVFVSGVFDLLHEEHKVFLRKAKDAGDILVVGVESDLRVKQLKGENRPIWNQERRVAEIEQTKIANFVFVLPEQFSKPKDHELLIQQLHPEILAVSAHSPFQKEKQSIVEKFGGKLAVVHEHNPEVSTTRILSQQS